MLDSQEFVCLFIFNVSMRKTFVIRKLKGPTPDNPKGQVGKFNGWGGKVEELDQHHLHAIQRETKEESGWNFNLKRFVHFTTEVYTNNSTVHYYYLKLTNLETNRFGYMQKSFDNSNVECHEVSKIINNFTPGLHEYVWNVPYLLLKARTFHNVQKCIWPVKEIRHE